jgi:flagellar M-ring protein FliF
MDTALAAKPPVPLAPQTGLLAQIAAMPAKTKLYFVIGLAALVATVMAITNWGSQGDYRVLYANLSDKDGGAIIAQLSQMNVPYRYAEGGSAILVPASKVHDARLKLASAGLPKGSVAGFELMDGARFGQTQFQERLSFQRGLEGELVRSITSLAAVQNARVHLALPNQNGFFREQQKPSASVVLSLHPGRTLDRAQVAGIVHLVSSSVPEMNPRAVSVLDQTGALLSGGGDEAQAAGLDANQLQYVNQIEAGYTKRVIELLEPIVGRDNLRASVTAEVDFSRSEATSEEFKPNQGSQASVAVRSQQSSESQGGSGAAPAGVPGAASNQPPVPATAPINGSAGALQAAQGNGTSNSRRDAVTNYEVDKTVRVTRNATGTIKRLNAAVVVNHRSNTDAKGKTTVAPLTADEIEKMTALVREGIGFREDRGDSVKVINAPFKTVPVEKVDVPVWKNPDLIDLVRAAAVPAALALVATFVFFGMVRPAVKAALKPAPLPAPGSQVNAVVDDGAALPAPGGAPKLEAPKTARQLEEARVLAKQNPAAVAGIVRGWVSGDT